MYSLGLYTMIRMYLNKFMTDLVKSMSLLVMIQVKNFKPLKRGYSNRVKVYTVEKLTDPKVVLEVDP